MLMKTDKSNLEQVRNALSGITGKPVSVPAPQSTWYMLVVRSGREFEAVDSIRRHGYQAYWPSYERMVATRRISEGRPVRRMLRIGIVPYVFTPADYSDFLDKKERIVGVIDAVRSFSGMPVLLRESDIQIIRKIDANHNTPKPEGPLQHDFKVGDRVKFVEDIKREWPPGRLVKLAKDGRIVVEITLMGRVVPITAFPFQIERT